MVGSPDGRGRDRDRDRGRITVPDLLFGLMSLAFLSALYPVFRDGLEANAGLLSTGELYLFQLILPGALLVFLLLIYVKAIAGAPS